jgi:hypothetical protein
VVVVEPVVGDGPADKKDEEGAPSGCPRSANGFTICFSKHCQVLQLNVVKDMNSTCTRRNAKERVRSWLAQGLPTAKDSIKKFEDRKR